jgi:acetate---CoA ligase (ADP-forming)
MSTGKKQEAGKRAVGPAPAGLRPALRAMLEARSVALVGASPRPGSFGQRMIDEVGRSPAGPDIYLVNPRYRQIGERRCRPSLADLPGPVDLVLLGVPDAVLEEQLDLAASRGDAAAVIFGNAHEDPPAGTSVAAASLSLRERLAAIAVAGGMELCGAGCMGFVNVARGLRAIGYVEPDQLPAGPVALVTHSGSVFSALLRSHRAIGFTLAVSSGQELVTTAAAYLEYALGLPETRVLALVLEAMREPGRLRAALASAAARDIPVVLLTVGNSAKGKAMVAAHSGALAARDGGWEALADAYGIHRVGDLAELADTLELFAIGRRARLPAPTRPEAPAAATAGPSGLVRPPAPAKPPSEPSKGDGSPDPSPSKVMDPGIHPARMGIGRAERVGIATVHDSGLERAHTADLADELGVPFAPLGEPTLARLADVLDPGLQPANPLDIWGTGADAQRQLADALVALADDPAVAAVALAVDLIREFDGDHSYPGAALAAAGRTAKPIAVLTSLASAVDPDAAAGLRQAGIPVLEGMRTGLLALRHLLDHAATAAAPLAASPLDAARRARGAALLAAGQAAGAPILSLLREYGIATARSDPAADIDTALAAASAIGYPVVLKTGEPAIAHKTEARGVILGIRDPAELAAAYRDVSARLGPRVLVCETVPPGTELALGIARDADLGPLIVVGAGGVLVELLADRVVALPPVGAEQAARMLGRLRAGRLLAGIRGAPPADTGAVIRAITGLSALAIDLGGELEALDVNPLICSPAGAVAVDALAIPRRPVSRRYRRRPVR